MDEEKKIKFVKIIKAMREEGSSVAEIKNNLKGIGLVELEIEEVIDSIDFTANTRDIHDKIEHVHEVISSGKHIEPAVNEIKKYSEQAGDMKVKINEIHGGFTEQSESLERLGESSEAHKRNLEEISKRVSNLTDNHESIKENLHEATFLRTEIREIKEILMEMKPLISGVAELQEKMLQTNKDLLIRIKK